MGKRLTTTVLGFFLCLGTTPSFAKGRGPKDLKWDSIRCRAAAIGLDVSELGQLPRNVILELPSLRNKLRRGFDAPHRLATTLEKAAWRVEIQASLAAQEDVEEEYLDVGREAVRQLLDAGYSAKTLSRISEQLRSRLLEQISNLEDHFYEGEVSLFQLADLAASLAIFSDPLGYLAHIDPALNESVISAPHIADSFRPKPLNPLPEKRSVEDVVEFLMFHYGDFIPIVDPTEGNTEIPPDFLFLPGNDLSVHEQNLLVGLPVITVGTRGNRDSFFSYLHDVALAPQYAWIAFPPAEDIPTPRAIEDGYLRLMSFYLRSFQPPEMNRQHAAAMVGLYFLFTHHAETPLQELALHLGASYENVLTYLQRHRGVSDLSASISELLTYFELSSPLEKRLGPLQSGIGFDDLYDAAVSLSRGHKESSTP
jgi:hypothetical protein